MTGTTHTASDPTDWRRFARVLAGAALAAGIGLYALLLIVDGYDTVWFAPALDREPVASNQRFSFPALARKPRFDSAVIGTSTTRLMRPAALDPLFEARFANLSLNDGTAWEQAQLLHLFARHHPRARAVLFGIDVVWCETGADFRKLTVRPFPPWMYDENRWNDLLNLYNLPALEETGRQLAYLAGARKPKYGKDGYTNFLPPGAQYDLERMRLRTYGPQGPHAKPPGDPAPGAAELAALRFPMHGLMKGMLAALPDATIKILMFVPYHRFFQPAPGSRADAVWAECRKRLVALAAGAGNAHVVDFMIDSALAREDRNYWDPIHYTVATADLLAEGLAEAVRARRDNPALYRYLGPR